MQSSDRSLGCVNVTEIQFCREVIDTPVTAQQYFASGSVQITDNLTLETFECKSRLKPYMINWLSLFTTTQLSFRHLFGDKLMEWKWNWEKSRGSFWFVWHCLLHTETSEVWLCLCLARCHMWVLVAHPRALLSELPLHKTQRANQLNKKKTLAALPLLASTVYST